MKCLIVGCPWSAAIGGMCTTHHHHFYVVLADDRYRHEPVPPCPMVIKEEPA